MDNPKMFAVVTECGMPIAGQRFATRQDAESIAELLNAANVVNKRQFQVIPLDSPLNYAICPVCGKQFHVSEFDSKTHHEVCIPQA